MQKLGIEPVRHLFGDKILAVGLVIALGNLVLEKPTQQKFGKFKAIVTVYGLILGTMAGTALMAYINDSEKDISALMEYARERKVVKKVQSMIGVWL